MNVLIVDGEKEISDLLTLYLEGEDLHAICCASVAEALLALKEQSVDLALLDVMLPDGDGFSLCRQLRETYNFPILMLTARVEDRDKISGLAFGADDYITKPFNPLEVVARVKASLEDAANTAPPQKRRSGWILGASAFAGKAIPARSTESPSA